MKIFVTSDPHFGHGLMAEMRGFGDRNDPEAIHTMNAALVAAINIRVGKKDLLYCLGDWAFMSHEEQRKLRPKINCKQIFLIRGNHDQRPCKDIFQHVYDYYDLKTRIDGKKHHFAMFHYPIAQWNKKHYGAYHLHGHCHGNFKPPYEMGNMMDVGVDTREDFTPYKIEEVKAIIDSKQQH